MDPDQPPETTKWTIHGERLIDDTRRLRLSVASVELPDGATFEQYVMRMPKAAMMVVLDDSGASVREVEEETGWRPRTSEPLAPRQPNVGVADNENLLFLSR